jgi:hypothetical protein
LMWKFWDCLRWTFCPIWNIGSIHNIVYGLNICKVSAKVLANFEQNFTQPRCSSRLFMFQPAKIAKGKRDRFTLPHVLDDQLTWCDRAGVRLKLKVTATQHHCCELPLLARWHPVQQVQFLFGQTTYVSSRT